MTLPFCDHRVLQQKLALLHWLRGTIHGLDTLDWISSLLWTGLVPYPNEFCSLSSVRRKLHACWLCKLGWKFFKISKVFVGLGNHFLGSQSMVESWNSIRRDIPVNLWAFSFIGPGVNRDIASVLQYQFARRRLEGEISQMCCIEIFAIDDGFYRIHHVNIRTFGFTMTN